MEEFTKLSEIERQLNKKNSKAEPPIDMDLGGDKYFDAFYFYLTIHLGGDMIFVCNLILLFSPL